MKRRTARATPVFSEEEIRQGIELMFFAYRDFTADPDRILAPLGMGRAHHRVVHFVGSAPGMTVGELLAILKITKQSLNRVLGQLMREGYIAQRPGETDRRERRLFLTPSGESLERRLSEPQRARVGGRPGQPRGPAPRKGRRGPAFRSPPAAVTFVNVRGGPHSRRR
jgi:DNA-binding MarR family transcriptional regulator